MSALRNGGELNLYESLEDQRKQIRLLSFESRDRLSLETFDIDDAPPYTALSYTWGEPSSEHSVWLNGHEIMIRLHLRMALTDIYALLQDQNRIDYIFRWDSSYQDTAYYPPSDIDIAKSTEALRYFWVDALCINQTDIQERNHQVSLMRQIYFQARTVCIWLEHYCEEDLEQIRTVTSRHRWKETAFDVTLGDKVMESPYWKRVWTLQEHMLARDTVVLSGSTAVNDLKLQEVDISGRANPLSVNLGKSFLRGWMRHKGVHFSFLLTYYPGLMCSDPRDCIYGLLGLVDWGTCKEQERIDADYTLTCQQLLKKLEIIGIPLVCQPRLLVDAALKERMERFAGAQV
jgi:hypothetical protein